MQRSLSSSERVEPEAFSQRVATKLGDAAGQVEVRFGKVWVDLDRGRINDALRTLQSDPQLDCRYFTFLSAVDWQEDGFEIVICVFSVTHSNTVILKAKIPESDARVESVTSVYPSANWHERECAEMFGIDFAGHPNLVNLYLPDDFEGHPLRKSFRLASRTFKPWPGAKDPDEAAGGGR